MAAWIVCFDPWHGLKPPVPALYPEWGERFVHCPGDFCEQQAQALAEAQLLNDEAPEAWLLVPCGRGAVEVEEAWAKIQAVFPALAGPLRIFWQASPGLAWEDPPDGEDGLRLDLSIEAADEGPAADWGRSLLLPLGLRFLLERGQWLAAQERKGLSRLEIRASRQGLEQTVAAIQARLAQTAAHIRYRLEALESMASEALYYDAALPPCTEILEGYRPKPCAFGPFYRQQLDEHQACTWLHGETDAILKAWAAFWQRTGQWRTDRLRELTRSSPAQPQPAQTPQSLQARFQDELDALARAEDQADFNRQAERQAQDLAARHGAALVHGLRQRPPRTLFLQAAAAFCGVAVLFNAAGAALQARAPAYPWLWPLSHACALAVGSLLVLWLCQWPKRRALDKARQALAGFAQETAKQAENLRDASGREVLRILLNRNVEIAGRERGRRELERRQGEYHLERLKQHFCLLDPRPAWAGHAQNAPGLAFDPARPETANEVYCWRNVSQQPPVLRVGQEERRLDDKAGRFAGLGQIIVESRR